jgi:predicted phage terminase large subunit-like protein
LWKRCTVETDLLSASLDPASFATWASRGTWETADHLEYLNTQLLSLASGEFDRLSVAMPPRHGKSFLCSWFFPAWFLLRYPTKRVLLVSYEADFAATWGRRVRDTVAEHGDRFGVQVKSDSKAASRFDLTAGGGMSTAGIGGPITGKGGDLVIIDDPVKNYAEAMSPTISNAQWDWYQTTLRTRLEPGARILLVMTRWAETDLSSRVVEGDEAWVDVRLPAFAEDDDPLGRDVGDALWPARFDVAALSKTRDALSGSHWSALYQGRPTPLDGDVFRKDWFTYWWNDDDGGTVTDNGPVELVETFMTVDLAISTKQSADPTVMAVWGRDKVDRLFLLDLYRKRVPGPTQVRALQRLDAEWNPHLILIEDVAYQRAFIQHAAQKGLPVKGVRPDGNKLARAIPAADMLETGRMFLPLIAKWLHIAEQELLAFPNGKHDDIVDVLSYAAMHVQAKRRRTKLVGWKLDPALTKPSMNI